MKISELVEQLNGIKREYGDIRQKPRGFWTEWVIEQTELGKNSYKIKLTHVIEYSAYQKLAAKLAEVEKECHQESKERSEWKREADQLREENQRLRLALEKMKSFDDNPFNHHPNASVCGICVAKEALACSKGES